MKTYRVQQYPAYTHTHTNQLEKWANDINIYFIVEDI